MNLQTIQTFFMWCTIINGALLLLTAMTCTFASDWVYRVQTRWYPISKDTFNAVIYCFIGLMKILFLTFNLVPFLALLLLG